MMPGDNYFIDSRKLPKVIIFLCMLLFCIFKFGDITFNSKSFNAQDVHLLFFRIAGEQTIELLQFKTYTTIEEQINPVFIVSYFQMLVKCLTKSVQQIL